MAKRDKLINAIKNNPKAVRIDDARKIAKWLGFTGEGGNGSHRSLSRPGEPIGLNFQSRPDGTIPTYQARQLIEMIEKYYSDEGTAENDPSE